MTQTDSPERPGPIFGQPWWLEAVAPGNWGEVLLERGGALAARLPYVRSRWRGFRFLTMPPLTQTLGPWLPPAQEKSERRLAREKEIGFALIDSLPAHDHFLQNFHFSVTNWLPFHWRGFRQTTRYTYRLEDLNDLDALWRGMSENRRREIAKAEKEISVFSDDDLDRFWAVNSRILQHKHVEVAYDKRLVERLDAACRQRSCRRIFFARDAQGRSHSALYVVWDGASAYFLMGGAHPDFRGSGANSLAMWTVIRFAATVSRAFDFEGSMIEPVENFFRGFGAAQVPYFQVSRTRSQLLRMILDVRAWGRSR